MRMTVGLSLILALQGLSSEAGAQQRRIALVIGNQAYSQAALENPARDAEAVAEMLKRQLGFEVTLRQDLRRDALIKEVHTFAAKIRADDEVLLYYAGHGFQIRGRNYLLGVDFDAVSEGEAMDMGYSIEALLDAVNERQAAVRMVIFDACRDNPFTRSWARQTGDRALGTTDRGFTAVANTGVDTYLVFSSSDGMVASDGKGQPHSPFAAALLSILGKLEPESIDNTFTRVRAAVYESTKMQQLPRSVNGLRHQYMFLTPRASTVAAASVMAETGPPSSPEMLRRSTDALTRMRTILREVLDKLEEARTSKDVYKLNCVNEKLTQIKGLLHISEQSDVSLQEAFTRHHTSAAEHEYTKVSIGRQKVDQLRVEAEECLGPPVRYFEDRLPGPITPCGYGGGSAAVLTLALARARGPRATRRR